MSLGIPHDWCGEHSLQQGYLGLSSLDQVIGHRVFQSMDVDSVSCFIKPSQWHHLEVISRVSVIILLPSLPVNGRASRVPLPFEGRGPPLRVSVVVV